MKNFKIGTTILFEENSLNYLSTLKQNNIFIVIDPFMVKNGTLDILKQKLNGKNLAVFSNISPDPTIEMVSEGIDTIKNFNPEVVIAIGGGSVIDTTKAIVHFGKQILNASDVTFIAIPTTSGTGSEVTNFSVITNKEIGVKYPIVSDSLLPDIAILEPQLVKSVPPSITADTGFDVLTHAIEAFVSTNSNDFSDALAIRAINLVFENLKACFENGENLQARAKMHSASCLAGIAFNTTSLGINHSIAHILGGKFKVPHGRANAILLPYIIEFNSGIKGFENNFSDTAKRYAEIAKFIGVAKGNVRASVKALVNAIISLQKELKIPATLSQMSNIDLSQFDSLKDEMAQIALDDKCTLTNPVSPTKDDIIKILERVKG